MCSSPIASTLTLSFTRNQSSNSSISRSYGPRADFLIIVRTSLVVPPFAFLADRVSASCPHVVINSESACGRGFSRERSGMHRGI
ncbi:hypothetical protein C8R46DRAFT_1077051, partial [Mycena filopes]